MSLTDGYFVCGYNTISAQYFSTNTDMSHSCWLRVHLWKNTHVDTSYNLVFNTIIYSSFGHHRILKSIRERGTRDNAGSLFSIEFIKVLGSVTSSWRVSSSKVRLSGATADSLGGSAVLCSFWPRLTSSPTTTRTQLWILSSVTQKFLQHFSTTLEML